MFGLHDCIVEGKYKGTSDLIFWVNGPFDLYDMDRIKKWLNGGVPTLETTKSPNQIRLSCKGKLS